VDEDKDKGEEPTETDDEETVGDAGMHDGWVDACGWWW
jgi:hypothetical protein